MSTPARVRPAYATTLAERMSAKDWEILSTVNRLHLLTGLQLDRLFFDHLSGHSRTVTRSRTLSRMVAWRVLQRLPRRIGGSRRGSSVAVYALDSAGQLLLGLRNHSALAKAVVRKPHPPSERFTTHILAVSELFVSLTSAHRADTLELRDFIAEPSSWWPNGLGGYLKPDAYFVLSNGAVDHLWWAEIDMATESMPTVQRKLAAYLDFLKRGQLGPLHAMPRVLIAAPNEVRQARIDSALCRLKPPASQLFHVVTQPTAATWLAGTLHE